MNPVRRIIEACSTKNASEVKAAIKEALDQKAVERIQEKKTEVASTYMKRT